MSGTGAFVFRSPKEQRVGHNRGVGSKRQIDRGDDDSRLDYGEQDCNGIDLTLIRECLQLTPTEHVRRGDRARRDALRLLDYGRRNRQERS